MSNELPSKCPQCGALVKESAPAGLCPGCLMALNLKTETVFTDDTPAAQPPLPPEQIAPHFPQLEILECLGRGGMGVVYKARQKSLNRLVALKLLAPERVRDPKFAERFAREAQALAALNHPNIVTIHDFGQAGGFYYLLMEFVDGVNLRRLLRARKFTPEEALAIVPPLCDALQFAHDRGIVHRDIKPENLLLDKAGRVKVADFGIAKMIEPETGGADLPVSPEIGAAQQHGPTGAIGTPSYSAPEQKNDPQRVDSRADIYSLGVVFYEMLTGELPGKTIAPPSTKVQIDVRLDEIVLRALEQKPELRFQQVSEVKTMVETIVGDPKKSEVGSRKPESESPRDWRIWSPFQSPEVREICAHLTEAERNVLMRRGGQFGIWINVIPVLVMMAGIQFHNKGIMLALAGVLILFYAASIFAVQWLNRRFLCSTDWARREGIKPESLRLFSFGKTPPGSSRRQPRQSEATAGEEDQTEKSESGKPAATNPLPVSDFWEALEVGNYGRAWDKTASYFQRDQSRDEWVARMEKERRPLGRSVDRKLVSTTIITPMTRTAVEILTTFANGQQLVEGVFSAVQPDGEWKVEKYYTRPVTSEVVAKAQTNLAKLSRFSRTAIVGACWVGCFLAAVVLGIILASPLNILSPLGNLAFGGLVSLLGFTAPLGTTILGWIAISQIRRSAGKLYGLWLAVFDGLLFPLLALDWLICIGGIFPIKALRDAQISHSMTHDGEMVSSFQTTLTEHWWWPVGAAVTIIVADVLIVWLVWRAVNKGGAGVPPADPGSSRREEAQTEKSEIGNRKSEIAPRFSTKKFSYLGWALIVFSLALGCYRLGWQSDAYWHRQQKINEEWMAAVQQFQAAFTKQSQAEFALTWFETTNRLDKSREIQLLSDNQHQKLKDAAESAKAECVGKQSVADDLGRQFTESRFKFYVQGMAFPIIALVAGTLILWLGRRQKSPGSAGVPPAEPTMSRWCFSYISSPAHLRSFYGTFWYIYEGKGRLQLNAGELTYTDHTYTDHKDSLCIPLHAIREIQIGQYSRYAKPLGLDYISVTYADGNIIRTRLFTPYTSPFAPTWKTNRLVAEWFYAIQAAIRKSQAGREAATPPSSDRPEEVRLEIPGKNAPIWLKLAVTYFLIAFLVFFPVYLGFKLHHMFSTIDKTLANTSDASGARIDQQQMEQARARTQAMQAANLSFGPVIELTLNLPGKGITDCLDLDSGNVVPQPDMNTYMDSQGNYLVAPQMQLTTNGIAIIVPVLQSPFRVISRGTLVSPCPQENNIKAWNEMTARELVNSPAVIGGEISDAPANAVRFWQLPNTFIFKTYKGNVGLLQIIGFTNNYPRQGVKIRYKLVQNTPAPETATAMPAFTLCWSAEPGEPDAVNIPFGTRVQTNVQATLRVSKSWLVEPAMIDTVAWTAWNGENKKLFLTLNNPADVLALEKATSENLGRALAVVWQDEVIGMFFVSKPLGNGLEIPLTISDQEASALERGLKSLIDNSKPVPPAAAQSLSFGPVVERMLPDQLGQQGPFINFESGELVSAPNSLVENRFDRTLLINWLVEAGADASAIAGENGGHSLVSYTRDTWFSEISPSSWERMNESGLLLAWQLAARTNKIVLGNPDLLPRTFVFETHSGFKGLLQITGFTNNPRGVKIRYKLVQNGNASKSNSDISAAMLAEPPKLQFLAWQDEWQTNQPGAARHPDGSPVTNAEELQWLKNVNAGGMNTTFGSNPRFLKLWFSHPNFQRTHFSEVSLLDDAGRPLKLGADGSSSCSLVDASEKNGQLGWRCWTGSPGEGTNFPAHLTVQLRYTIGPLERTQEVKSDFNGTTSLEGNSILNGIGQNAQGRAFVAIAVNAKNMQSRVFDAVAVAKDGREISHLGSGRGGSVGSGVDWGKFEYAVPLSDVSKFIIGTRPIRTMEWTNVVLPKN